MSHARRPDVDSVTNRFERAAMDPNADRRNFSYYETMKDASKLSAVDQQKVIKNLVEKGILPDVAVGTGTVRNPGEANILGMYEKGNRSNPKNFQQRMAQEMSTSSDHVNRARDLLERKQKHGEYDYRQRSANAAETANAQRHLDSLITKAGTRESYNGLDQKDIDKLLSDPRKLSEGETRALKFMKENYDKLYRGSKDLDTDKITVDSLKEYSKKNLGTKDSTMDNAKRAQIEKEVLNKSQITVKDGEGYWSVAERRLKEEGNTNPSSREIASESQRLQRLNRGKTELQPGDKLRSLSDQDIEKEIAKRLRDAA